MFPVFGFGGIPQHMNLHAVNHCFPVTGNQQNFEVSGIEGIIGAYRQTLPQIKFSGPTYFGPILEGFKNHCQRQVGQTSYNILLLLTDGTIHDMPKTKEVIVDLC